MVKFDGFEFSANELVQILRDPTANTTPTINYNKYTKENIMTYLRSPMSYSSTLIDVSRYFFMTSPQYRMLNMFYAYMPKDVYILSPLRFDPLNLNDDVVRSEYYEAARYVEKMNLQHELKKARLIAYVEGTAFGVICENDTQFFVQYLPAKICTITGIVNGTLTFSIDCSQLKEAELTAYPEIVTTLWNQYQSTNIKLQEVPKEYCFCLKSDETNLNYVVPTFVGVIPQLFELENAREIYGTSNEIGNYKLVTMELPVHDDGSPKMEYDTAMRYYRQVSKELPDYIGLALTPMKMDSINFNKNAVATDNSAIAEAESTFWSSSGASAVIFGRGTSETSGALKMNVAANAQVAFALQRQEERLINRILETQGFSWKIQFLDVSIFNEDEKAARYKEMATLGIPVKMHLSALMGLDPIDVEAMAYLENTVLKCADIFVPLQSSYNSSERGRPEIRDDELSDSGEKTRDTDGNENRG